MRKLDKEKGREVERKRLRKKERKWDTYSMRTEKGIKEKEKTETQKDRKTTIDRVGE